MLLAESPVGGLVHHVSQGGSVLDADLGEPAVGLGALVHEAGVAVKLVAPNMEWLAPKPKAVSARPKSPYPK